MKLVNISTNPIFSCTSAPPHRQTMPVTVALPTIEVLFPTIVVAPPTIAAAVVDKIADVAVAKIVVARRLALMMIAAVVLPLVPSARFVTELDTLRFGVGTGWMNPIKRSPLRLRWHTRLIVTGILILVPLII